MAPTCEQCCKELAKSRVDVYDLQVLFHQQSLSENSTLNTIENQQKNISQLEDEVDSLQNIMVDLQLQVAKVNSPLTKLCKDIDLNQLTSPTD